MSEVKTNKDGLVPGSLVDPKTHARILREQKKAELKAAKDKASK